MQLNDIIEENTLPTISRKTRISVENLQALIDRDWSRLQKVQALGFISILEREYHADLGKLREECRAYYEEHAPAREPDALVVSPVEKEGSGVLYKALLVLVLLALAYGAWKYMAAAPAGKSDVASASEPRSGFFDSVLSMTKGWLGEEKPGTGKPAAAQESPSGAESGQNPTAVSEGAWAEKNGSEGNDSQNAESNDSSAKPLTIAKVETAAKQKSGKSDEAQEEEKIITQVKQEQAKAEALRRESAQAPEENGEGNLSDVSRMIVAATAGADEEENASRKEAASTSAGQEQAEASEKEAEENPSAAERTETAAQPAEAALEIPEPKAKKPAAVTDSLVIFHPRSKVWVGYTELRSMKRTAKVATGDITFDTSKGDYILATGHGKLEFKGKNTLKLNDGKRHFFMIAKGGVREISHEEFQRLNKSKVW
ncbi:hypothetical protein [Nitratifractor salsuginis]|uniref:Uncharacterized protein n=1 Tax=Nitratifractor salsuginis (strain DSM 16511 / JCM 12458 / E9I37-1) TaxID=749222 RepID=E6X228_NITSE|nr:hypothetical protein [Nitratifractor salsuginis]ADV47097.1 hypothetical protein Nitsa_1852 [Nitratifractor salsuginis DSM 16511]